MSLRKCKTPLNLHWWLPVLFLGITTSSAGTLQKTKERLVAVGWVQAAGEVRIYARKADLGKLYDGSCISGLMTHGRTMPKKFANRHVAVYGTLVDSKEFDEMTLQFIITGVENYCNSPEIAIITRIVPVNDP
jgi:hypothetical protein